MNDCMCTEKYEEKIRVYNTTYEGYWKKNRLVNLKTYNVYHITPNCIILHFNTSHYITLYYIIPYYVTIHYTVL